MPERGSQVPASWHWSDALQTTGFVPVQVPLWQVSVWVHASPSLQVAPFGLAGLEHVPVWGSQMPASWHWSEALHTTALAPVQVPARQVSVWVQALPSSQVVPFACSGLGQAPVAGLL